MSSSLKGMTFSEFIRNATPEQKELVYMDVMKRATDRQNAAPQVVPVAAATEAPVRSGSVAPAEAAPDVNKMHVSALLGDFGGLMDQEKFDEAYGRFRDKEIWYPADCDRIVAVAREYGISMTPTQAQAVWEAHSDSMCASWLILGDDLEIYNAIHHFIDKHAG